MGRRLKDVGVMGLFRGDAAEEEGEEMEEDEEMGAGAAAEEGGL